MKRTPVEANCFLTASTTSTTGPHVRLVQNFGVAKTTTNGLCAASEPATEYWRRPLSGGVRVVKSRKLPFVLAIVGVSEAIACDPTAGARGCDRTSIVADACAGFLPGASNPSV